LSLLDSKDLSTAVGIAHAVKSRAISPVEIVDAAIERIESRNPSLNAVTYEDRDGARKAAIQLEQAILREEPTGPLAGVPVLMKDLFGFKPGWPATCGSISALRDNLATDWSMFPKRIEAAGGIILGQTNSPVFGFRGTTDNKSVGPTRNPFDLDRNAGGSSGGSAAAVADGLVPIAGATDGGGSIRIPAAWCGTVGFQPSAGRVPFIARPNAFGISCYLYEGPITRTVADAALAMTALQGQDNRDPASLTVNTDFEQARRQGVRGKRIAFTPDFGIFPVDTKIAGLIREAVCVFEGAGAIVEEVDVELPHTQAELSAVWSRTTAIGIYDALEDLRRGGRDLRALCPDELPAGMMAWVDAVPTFTLTNLLHDQKVRTRVLDRFGTLFETYDYVISPTLAAMPVFNGRDGETQGPTEINGIAVDPLIGWCMTYLTNYTGNPSASVPAGLIDGLPVGMLVIGRRHDDAGVMAAIGAFERERPWEGIYRIPEARTLASP
jgi:amidase/aspartyl-tRNA(Asn)/glutamyl-tRNA(Gln) amidotransferase subunit A